MNKRIDAYVDELFANMPNEQYVSDIKEELLSNLNERYSDLRENGKSEEEAYQLVIASIGDIRDLFGNEEYSAYLAPRQMEKIRNKGSVLMSLGAALYVLSLAALLLLGRSGSPITGLAVMIVICAVATGIVIYAAIIGSARYVKADDTFVENYKEKMLDSDRNRKIKRSIGSSLWSLTVVIYLAASFITNRWSVTWIIFLIAALVQQLIRMLMAGSAEKSKAFNGALWTSAVIVYFIVSFAFSAWAWSWMIFLVTVATQEIMRLITLWRSSEQ